MTLLRAAAAASAVLFVTTTARSAGAQNTPSTSSVPVPAWPARGDGADVVVLRDGGMVRGKIAEIRPGEHVRVALITGQVALLPWGQIHHIEEGTTPAAAPPAPSPPAPDVPHAAAPPGRAPVHLVGEGMTLEEDHAGLWTRICTAPCDQELPLDVSYRVSGPGIKTSPSFRLAARPGERVAVTPDGASTSAFAIGLTMLIGGGVVGTVAFYGLIIASTDRVEYDYETGYHTSHGDVTPWLVTLGVGAAVGTLGLVLAVVNEKTTVNQQLIGGAAAGGDSHAAERTRNRMRSSALYRAPVWHERSPWERSSGRPAVVGFPLLSGTF